MKQVEELTKRAREAEKEKQVLEEEGKGTRREREGVKEREDMTKRSGAGGLAGRAMRSAIHVPLQEAGKQLGMAKSVEELGKQLEALQARMVAAEMEIKKLTRRAETAGITATGKAGREKGSMYKG